MKKYRVTVNGTVYEVELEELTGSAPVSAPAAPAAAPAPAASAAPAAGEQICAPMPGNILAVNVTAGQAVKKGDVLMVLEAMKMENEIMCPRDGVVASVNTSKGRGVRHAAVRPPVRQGRYGRDHSLLQDTGFYLFSQDGNWRCLIMLGIACVLLYLGIVKKFEPLLLVPIAFGMLITNLPGANMFHEIFFAGGHIHWDLIGGQPVTASLLADLHSQGVAENVLAPYIQQLMTAAQTTFSPEMVEQAIAAVTEEAGAAITALEAQL